MHYNTNIQTLQDFYDTLYNIPSRLDRKITTPKAVTTRLLADLGSPQQHFRSVLVTGSKGKGSAAIMLGALLTAANKCVGLFSSPHLFDYRERIVVDGEMIDPVALLESARRVFVVANALPISHPDEFPRFFEMTTAIAYLYFAEKGVDYAVIETGIGALTDATNQNVHQLAILTNIESEHLEIFGSLENIVKEKSGVIKQNTPLVLGDLSEETDQLIINRAAEMASPVTRFKRKYLKSNKGFHLLKIGDKVWISDSLSKAKNAWLALTAFDMLDVALSDEEKVQVLSHVKLPAREEVVSKAPFIIIDSAHTAQSATNLANYVAKSVHLPVRKTILLLSFSAKKNIAPILNAFPEATTIVLTQATNTRSLPPEVIADAIVKTEKHAGTTIKIVENPLKALEKAMKKLKANDVLIVTGSVYLAGLISQQFRKSLSTSQTHHCTR